MYSLAPRFPEPSLKPGIAIDPTSYDIEHYEDTCQLKGESYAFAGKLQRFKPIKDNRTPTPAHYFPKYRKTRIIGGTSLQYTAPRICLVPKRQVPTAFQYNPYPSTTNFQRKVTRKEYIHKIFKQECPDLEPIELSSKSQELLRELSASVSLPLYLTFPGETNKTTLRYKGPRWAESKTQRNGLDIRAEGPGPGSYEIESKAFPVRHIVQSKHRIFSEEPPCYPPVPTERPGVEQISTQLNVDEAQESEGLRYDYLFKKISHNKSNKGLWGQAKRFTSTTNDNPPPWAYDLENKSPPRLIKVSPFASCAPRFKTIPETGLGPASYSQNFNTIMNKICKTLPKINKTLRAPFGSTQPRLGHKIRTEPTDDMDSDHDDETNQTPYLSVIQILDPPKPKTKQETYLCSEYILYTEAYNEDLTKAMGPCFNIHEHAKSEEHLVNIGEIYSKLKGRVSHRKQIENEGFLSTTFKRSEWLDTHPLSRDLDWPPIKDKISVVGGAIKMDAPIYKRAVKPKMNDSWVFYDVHPHYSSSVYKTTHNFRLKLEEDVGKPSDASQDIKCILKCFIPKEILNA